MKLQYLRILKNKIRYRKENDHYVLLFNKRFLNELTMCFFLRIDKDLLQDMLINTFKAIIEKSRWGYPIYTFKTKALAKEAVKWLKSLEVINKICD